MRSNSFFWWHEIWLNYLKYNFKKYFSQTILEFVSSHFQANVTINKNTRTLGAGDYPALFYTLFVAGGCIYARAYSNYVASLWRACISFKLFELFEFEFYHLYKWAVSVREMKCRMQYADIMRIW